MKQTFVPALIVKHVTFPLFLCRFSSFVSFSFQLNSNRFQGLNSLEDITAIINTPPIGSYQVNTSIIESFSLSKLIEAFIFFNLLQSL